MITKNQFCSSLTAIKEQLDKDEKSAELLQVVFPESFICFGNNDGLIDSYITLLKESTGDSEEDSLIEYFIYELDFGTKWTEDSFTVYDESIDISTSEKLFYYLEKESLGYNNYEARIDLESFTDIFMQRKDFYIISNDKIQVDDYIHITAGKGNVMARKVTPDLFIPSDDKIKIAI